MWADKMWIYDLLDVAATITEAAAFYVIMLCFCKTCRFQKAVSRLVPPVVYAVVIIILTFWVDIGAYRIFILLPLMAGLVLLCYRVSIHRALIVMELAYLLIVPLSESVVLTIMNFVYRGDVMTQVDGISIIKWQIYLFIMLIRLLLLIVCYRLLKNFKYEIQLKDTVILLSSFLLVLCVSFASTYGYLNLGISDTFTLDFVTSVLGVFFIMQFLYSRNVSYLREQEQRDKMQIAKLEQQYVYYQDKFRDEERIRAIYHDMKNHLLVLEGSQGAEASRQMAGELRAQIADYENYIHTGNDFLDIIIRDKAEKAREKHIDFSAMIDFEDVDFIEPLDLSTLFGNGIDNAIEASEKLPENARVILIKAGKVQDFVSVLMENNCLEDALLSGRSAAKSDDVSVRAGRRAVAEDSSASSTGYATGAARRPTAKADSFLHGFGISNMQKAAEKYGGTCATSQAVGKFTLKILLPVPAGKAVV